MDYLRFGSGDRVFVILPGLSIKSVLESSSLIARQYERIAKDHTVYLFDRRKTLPSSYTVADMAADTARAMDALGLRDVFLFGASQGGMIAQVISIKRPELVNKLILGSSSSCVTDGQFSVIERWISLSKTGDRVDLYLDFGEKIYPPDVFEKYRDELIRIANTVTDDDLRRFEILAEGTRGFDITGELYSVRCPVFVIGARDDSVLGPDAADRIAEALPESADSRLHIYDGYGHAAFDTAPDYCDRIFEFLRQ